MSLAQSRCECLVQDLLYFKAYSSPQSIINIVFLPRSNNCSQYMLIVHICGYFMGEAEQMHYMGKTIS